MYLNEFATTWIPTFNLHGSYINQWLSQYKCYMDVLIILHIVDLVTIYYQISVEVFQ